MGKTAFLGRELFSLGRILEKQLYHGNNTMTKVEPYSDQSSYGDKNQERNRRILGLSGGVGISLKAAYGKEQEMVSGITCDLSDL